MTTPSITPEELRQRCRRDPLIPQALPQCAGLPVGECCHVCRAAAEIERLQGDLHEFEAAVIRAADIDETQRAIIEEIANNLDNAGLPADNADLSQGVETVLDQLEQTRERCDRLQTERDAAVRDASRYRWLRLRLSEYNFAYGENPSDERPVAVFDLPPDLRVSAGLDATIDAAMLAGGE